MESPTSETAAVGPLPIGNDHALPGVSILEDDDHLRTGVDRDATAGHRRADNAVCERWQPLIVGVYIDALPSNRCTAARPESVTRFCVAHGLADEAA